MWAMCTCKIKVVGVNCFRCVAVTTGRCKVENEVREGTTKREHRI